MATLDSLVTYIRPEAHGCLDSRIKLEMLFVVRDLCERAKIWKEESEISYVVPSLSEVDLQLPNSKTEIVTIDYVLNDGFEIIPATEYELTASVSQWREQIGVPTHYVPNLGNRTMRLYPTPNVSGELEYQLTLKPSLTATEVKDFLVSQFLEAIIDGTLARVLGMNGQTWTNINEALRRKADYEIGVRKAKDKTYRPISTTSGEMLTSPLV